MMKSILFVALLFFSGITVAQPEAYDQNIAKAEDFYKAGAYQESARHYSTAFESYGWKGYMVDRFNAARAWSMAGVPDSAFFNLFRIAEKGGYDDLNALRTDPAFAALQVHPRWQPLCDIVKSNMPTMPELAEELRGIWVEDQRYRSMLDSVDKQFGWGSKEMNALNHTMMYVDSVNSARVTQILDKHGWLGDKEVGSRGNQALFLVIQHADIEVQEKYLPKMREAVKNGKARGADLALLEDRVRMRNGQKQLYGSQLRTDQVNGGTYFFPIEDVDHVDERRASVGLQPIAEYAQYFGIVWDAATIEDNKKREVPPAEPRGKQ
ncbi:MAG: hypothetical protein JNJ57_16810 [Saprospiraceae bacterium]|nr:hypothetical protein [Saprospiraceae bacterium]